MTDADRGHLARLEHGLQDVQSDLGEEASAAVDDALERVRAYRETVEGASGSAVSVDRLRSNRRGRPVSRPLPPPARGPAAATR